LKKISIMNWDDQFDVASAVLGYLAHENIELTDEQEQEIIDVVIDYTDIFSIGMAHIEEEPE